MLNTVDRIVEPNPSAIDRVFANAVERRTLGRPGLFMQSRFPTSDRESASTSGRYTILQGFSDVFINFESWLSEATGAAVHGHLYGPGQAHFCGGNETYVGGLSSHPTLRDLSLIHI